MSLNRKQLFHETNKSWKVHNGSFRLDRRKARRERECFSLKTIVNSLRESVANGVKMLSLRFSGHVTL